MEKTPKIWYVWHENVLHGSGVRDGYFAAPDGGSTLDGDGMWDLKGLAQAILQKSHGDSAQIVNEMPRNYRPNRGIEFKCDTGREEFFAPRNLSPVEYDVLGRAVAEEVCRRRNARLDQKPQA